MHALNVGDVDLDSHTVLVRRGKGGKRRVSVFGDQARLAIRKYLKLRTDKYTADSPLWISTRSGKRLSDVYLGKILSDLGDAAGVDLHAHMTRHMFTDRAYRDGMPIKALMTLGGRSGKIPATYGAGPSRSARWRSARTGSGTGALGDPRLTRPVDASVTTPRGHLRVCRHARSGPGHHVDQMTGYAYPVVRVLPTDHQDQRHCSGCHREQDDQASGLRPSGFGRSSDLGNQAPEGAIPFSHAVSLVSNATAPCRPLLTSLAALRST